MTRVLICASCSVMREGIASLLRSEAFDVVGAVENISAIEEAVRIGDPDVIVLAIEPREEEAWAEWLSDRAGDSAPESAEVGGWPAASALPPIVVLAGQIEMVPFDSALAAGVRALLPGDADSDEIISAIQAAAAGLIAARPETLDHLQRLRRLQRLQQPHAPQAPARPLGGAGRPPYYEALTPRETEVLRMLAEGLANKEIARRLKISEHTVKFHIGSILGKLSASSRTEAVTIGIRLGLIAV